MSEKNPWANQYDDQGRHAMRFPCEWCGVPSVTFKLVERAIIRSIKGVKTVVATERRLPACETHAAIPEAEEATVTRARNAARSKGWKGRQEKLI